jgi:Zn-dependent protease/CBS domain-containing protein
MTLFTVRGIKIKVHATFAIVVAIGATQWAAAHGLRGALFGAVFTLALFTCVLLHELGHGFVAQRYGLQVKQIVLLPIGGIASLGGKPQSPKQEIAIAIAGPLVNIVLALTLAAGLGFSGAAANLTDVGKLGPSWQTFLFMLTAGNASLALFNLLPFFPLDGGRVLRALLSLKFGELRATRWAAGLGQLAGVVVAGFALVSGQIILALIGTLVFMAASRERAAVILHPSLQALAAADVAEVPAIELEATTRIGEAIPQLLRTAQETFPIVGDGVLLGVVSRGDLVLAAQRPDLRLRSIRTLAQPIPELPSHLSAAEALQILEELGAPLGVVVTPDYPLGFISHAQVFSKLAQLPATILAAKIRPEPNVRPGGSPDLPRNPA